MSEYELPDDLFARSVVQPGDPIGALGLVYAEYDNVKPKFDSVAAAIMWDWSLSSFQDDDCGDAQLGNGWHALFRDERAILHTGNSGFVSAWRIEDGADVDTVWAGIGKGARYMDDVECEGHNGEDAQLTDGTGIGETTYCDGSCRGDV